MYNNFVVEGEKMATEIIQHQGLKLEGIFALAPWIKANRSLLKNIDTIVQEVSQKDLARISSLKTPNQVLVVCKVPTYELDLATINTSLTLFLENLQNPGNMGSILRIADWFGLPYVFCSKNTVEAFNPKVIQASMGAFLRVKIISIEFSELMKNTPDLPTFAAVLQGENVFKTELPKNGLLIIGNEGAGVSEEIIQQASHLVRIPKGQQGGAESLNAAVAAGILCAALTTK
ncbi:MAG: RNA methyltransferase [Saprospiraceae bacterium]